MIYRDIYDTVVQHKIINKVYWYLTAFEIAKREDDDWCECESYTPNSSKYKLSKFHKKLLNTLKSCGKYYIIRTNNNDRMAIITGTGKCVNRYNAGGIDVVEKELSKYLISSGMFSRLLYLITKKNTLDDMEYYREEYSFYHDLLYIPVKKPSNAPKTKLVTAFHD